MQAKQALDTLFADMEFDTRLYNKLLINNVEFMTRTQEYSRLFSGRSIGCYLIKYTMYDKNIFYDNLFDMEMEDAVDAIKTIKTIPASFKIARDDINMVTFYMAHRFLSNPKLSDKQKVQYAEEALNYFSYRTLVLISSMYFVYPISEAKATSLTERLSGKYVIKNVRNWNEYCQYRSSEYLQSKYKALLVTFDNDKDLPNAITDLFSRTKDTLKNIYTEFMTMLEKDEVMASKTATVTNMEGQESIADRVDNIQKYVNSVDDLLTDRSTLVKKPYVTVVVDILHTLAYNDLEAALDLLLEYAYSGKDGYVKVSGLFKDVLGNAVDYLQKNSMTLNVKSDIVEIMNSLVGNVLYARGNNVSIHHLKQAMDKTLRQIYKQAKININDRNIANVRNGVYLYVVLAAMVH